jgi:hypothetical protein
MASVAESAGSQNPLQAALDAGLDVISQQASICFKKYLKVVLPLDGFIFWVEASTVNPSAVLNTSPANSFAANAVRVVPAPPELFDWPPSPIGEFTAGDSLVGGTPGTQPGSAAYIEAEGSIHYATSKNQREDETIAINRVVFTSEVELQDMNEVGPTVMFIGEFEGQRFAFSQRKSFYVQANIYHYVGDAIYPAMESQIIDANNGLDISTLVVSNSLPFWLAFAYAQPFFPSYQPMPVFPSFAVPDNWPPPYASIHIGPDDTEALASVPSLDANSTHWQLAADKVRVTIYGRRNDPAMDLYDAIMVTFYANTTMGLMNTPVMRDEKRTQAELGILAMKKSIEFRVSYYQYSARNIARQLIEKAIVGYTFPKGLIP